MRAHTITESPIGDLTLINTDGVLSGLFMNRQARSPRTSAFGERVSAGFEQVTEELREYFSGDRMEFTVSTAARGNDFEHRVWRLLRRISYGETRSYGDLAHDLGDPTLAREVGVANAGNPIAIVVPCHRVIGSDGSLTGYAGGLERKRFLLDLEMPANERYARLF
ncbi:MAG: methylated-DNA--[protein]-cysteine S-methyltransferase [Actinomycetota bacterium]